MINNSFIFTQKVIGQERKAIAALISEITGEPVIYAGVPSFAYKVGGWSLGKSGIILSPQTNITEVSTLRAVIDVLKTAGLTAEGDATLILSAEAHTGGTLRNLCNLISSKGKLLAKALGRDNEAIPQTLVEDLNNTPIDTVEDFMRVYNSGLEAGRYVNSGDIWLDHLPNEIGLCFFNATLNADEVFAYITLAQKLNEMAITQKHTSSRQKSTENEAYTMRCYLLRLGFIGDEYKTSRKLLLSKLNGNRAYSGGIVNESN
jgi:hypothetical protein